MRMTFGYNLFAVIDGFVDRAIGADQLSPPVRQKLLAHQLASVRQMIPALMAASLVVSTVLVTMSWGTSRFWPVLCGAGVVLLLCAHAFYLGARYESAAADKALPPVTVWRTVVYAALLGVVWGLTLNLLPVSQDTAMRGAASIAMAGLLCIAMMALVNFPQALAAFALPYITGSLGTVLSLDSAADLWIQGLLLTGFTFVMVLVTFNHASAFVAHRASESLVKEKKEIIGLLLREFEQSTSDWIWGFGPDGAINRLSGGFTAATGVSEEALIGADFLHFLQCITPPGDPLISHVEHDVEARATFQDVELRVIADGKEAWWNLTGKPAFDDSGAYLGYIGTGSDITERKVAERRITILAHHDAMTGLLNRTKFTEQLNSCVARLERYGTPFSVMFLDLDQFKSVNDTRGHMVGDRLLMLVAKRLLAQVRETDMAARLGGDEFAILLPGDSNAESLAHMAGRLIEDIRAPFQIDEDQVTIGVSIGIAIAPINGTRPDQILRNADLALYRAKADGRSVHRFFESQMDSEARERRMLEAELRDAITNCELVLHYQPLVAAIGHETVGFEALIRWEHPIRGLVAPAEFIPLAEQSNLIVDIGDWTILQACIAATHWPEHLTVAVNLSAKHFRRSDISQVVQRALAMSGLAPERLEIEITEGLLLEHPDEVVAKLAEIRRLGVTVAMDDFGTGYSSLSYLLKFPFDKIKIDRSFVDASSGDEVARDILKAIASLGKTLKLKITAEGVETREQAEFLAQIACHQLQGFYFARPMNAVEMAHFLLSRIPTRAGKVRDEAEQRLALRVG
jgi:diguanylate cyclase (GGDEF)-like protein/PAS domain S-box-containing protein